MYDSSRSACLVTYNKTESVVPPIYGPLCGTFEYYRPLVTADQSKALEELWNNGSCWNNGSGWNNRSFFTNDYSAHTESFLSTMCFDAPPGFSEAVAGTPLLENSIVVDLDTCLDNVVEGKDYILYLKFEDGKYYIERTRNPKERLCMHRRGKGCKWTSQYALEDVRAVEFTASLDLDSEVKRLMFKHGIANVRGGSYNSCNLTNETRHKLKREIFRDLCYKCKESGHLSKDCKR